MCTVNEKFMDDESVIILIVTALCTILLNIYRVLNMSKYMTMCACRGGLVIVHAIPLPKLNGMYTPSHVIFARDSFMLMAFLKKDLPCL